MNEQKIPTKGDVFRNKDKDDLDKNGKNVTYSTGIIDEVEKLKNGMFKITYTVDNNTHDKITDLIEDINDIEFVDNGWDYLVSYKEGGAKRRGKNRSRKNSRKSRKNKRKGNRKSRKH